MTLFTAKTEEGYSSQTVIHLRAVTRKIFNDGIRWRKFKGPNPAKGVPVPALTRKAPSFATAEDVVRIMANARGPFRTLAAISILAGLRESEILGLERSDIHLETGLVMVNRTATSETPKGKKFRAVPISSELRPILERHLEQLEGDVLFPEYRNLVSPRQTILRELHHAKINAGVVKHWELRCRRKGCGLVVTDSTPAERR